LLVVKGSRIRATNEEVIRIPERPFIRGGEAESESLGIYLLPQVLEQNRFMVPNGYHSPLLYIQEKFVDITAYEARAEGLLEVTSRYSKKQTSLLFVPQDNRRPIFGVGRQEEIVKGLQMLRAYGGQDAHLAFHGLEFDIRRIEAAYPNDQWIYSFEDDQGYIQRGIVYGTQINQDALAPQLRARGFPNQVGIYINAQNTRLKVRVLKDGIQFHGFVPKHLLAGHPQLGNPWPYIVTVMQNLAHI
jgi:hypothetical protein